MAKIIEGKIQAEGLRFGIVVSRFNSFITERLLEGALDALRRNGVKEDAIEICRTPGSFEIPAPGPRQATRGGTRPCRQSRWRTSTGSWAPPRRRAEICRP